MAGVKTDPFIKALSSRIAARNKIKTQASLDNFNAMDADTQNAVLDLIHQAPDAFIFPVLVEYVSRLNPETEVHPLREALFSKALDSPSILIAQLQRAVKPRHRILLAEIAGELKLENATPVLLSILSEERDEKILRATIAALGAIGDPAATTPVSEFLYSGSVELIISAIQALGHLGNPTAFQRLAQKLGSDQDLDDIIMDVFSRSQEVEALEQLNATLSAHQAHVRNAGKQRLIDIGPKVVPVMIKNLYYDDPDLMIHTIDVLGIVGDESAIAPIRKLLHNEPKDPNVRFAAYEALGKLPIAKGAFALAQGLDDPVANVRSAAASAIDHNYNTVLAAGIKNMIRDEDPVQRPITRTLIEAECDTVVLDLIQQEGLAAFIVDYLSRHAHHDIRDHYLEALRKNGMAKIASTIAGRARMEARSICRVFAVDDSRMILNIYRSVLHHLGYEPMLFEYPALAVEAARSSKPHMIFTDLNMPHLNGIEFTKAIRRMYPKEDLPIVMITTQNECQDNEAACKAGVNAILHKPFNEEDLREVMDTYLVKKAA